MVSSTISRRSRRLRYSLVSFSTKRFVYFPSSFNSRADVVFEQSEQQSKLKDELAGPLRVMQEAARRIAKIAIESKLPLVEGSSLAPSPSSSKLTSLAT